MKTPPLGLRVDGALLDRCSAITDRERRRFLNGGEAHWGIAQDPQIALAPLGTQILDELGQDSGLSVDLVLAPPGGGATTLLLQLAARLTRDGLDVRWFDEGGIDPGARADVLLIDHADAHVAELHRLLRGGGQGIKHVVAASRAPGWSRVRGHDYGWSGLCDRFRPWDLEPDPAFALRAAAVDADLLLQELDFLSGDARRAVLAIALVQALELPGLPARHLAAALELEDPTPLLESLRREAPVAVASADPPRFETRHPELARALVGRCEGELAPLLCGLVASAARSEDEDDAPLARAGSRVLSRLGDLLDEPHELARAAADASWQAHPRIAALADQLGVLRRAGESRAASELAAARWPELESLDDGEAMRPFLLAWARTDAERAPALAAYALSDQLDAPLDELELKRALVLLADTVPLLEPLAGLRSELPGPQEPTSWTPSEPPPDAEAVAEALAALPTGSPVPEQLAFEGLRRAYNHHIGGRFGPLLAHVPEAADAEDLYIAFSTWCEEAGIEPYPAQDEAFAHLAENESVLLCTPTGSGKSLVALAAHFYAFARGERSVYTAPTKALVNEKFFSLCGAFGSRNVGLITGDGAVNRDAPMICCTAEILSNMALREGRATDFRSVVMDEFHYYGDRDRGMAWLLPLVEMRDARFLLLSATVGAREAMREQLERQTGSPMVLVEGNDRPVPLKFTYRDTPLLESIGAVQKDGLTPAYIVCFSKKEAATLASDLRQVKVEDPQLKSQLKLRRAEVHALLKGHDFGTPFGKQLKSLLPDGIAVHHAGMLPRYRRLVEQLAEAGHVTLICGTDTLGVGINMPIRTVLFTQLYKFDGRRTRHLRPREFHQIAGRAGRKGYDTVGHVWAQPPEHEIINQRERKKAKEKNKKFYAKDAPRDFRGWDSSRFKSLQTQEPKALETPFRLSGTMVLGVLGREGDGLAALHDLIDRVALPDSQAEKEHALADAVVEDLRATNHLRRLGEAWQVLDQRTTSTYERPLGRFLNHSLAALDEADPDFAWRALSCVESILDDPHPVLRGQVKVAKDLLYAELRRARREDPEQEQEIQTRIDALTWPEPEADFLEQQWALWMERNPSLVGGTPSPKSVVREMIECAFGFNDYIREYGLGNEEGRLLYYLSDAVRLLSRELPEWVANHEHMQEIVEGLDVLVRSVDASVVREWERFEDPSGPREDEPEPPPLDVTKRPRAFRVLVRNVAFGWVRRLAHGRHDLVEPSALRPEGIQRAMEPYWARYSQILLDSEARGPSFFTFEGTEVRQTLLDPDEDCEWAVTGTVDIEASRAAGKAVVTLTGIGPIEA